MAEFFTGVFTMNTGAGNQTVVGPSFHPNAVLFFPIPHATVDGAVNVSAKRCFGAATSSTQRWAHSVFDEDASPSGDCQTRFTSSKCLLDISDTGAVLWDADFVDFTDTGFTIDVTTPPASAFRVYYLAISCDSAVADTFTVPTSGASVTESTGFNPDALICLSGANSLDTAEVDYKLGISFATAAEQQVVYVSGLDLVGTSRKQDAINDGLFLYGSIANSTVVDWQATVALETGQFTVNISNNPTTQMVCGYLALGGMRSKCVTDTTATTPTTKPTGGVGLEPECMLLFNIRETTVDQVPTRESPHLSFGVATGVSEVSGTYTLQIDGAGTEDSASIQDDSWIMTARSNTGGGTILTQATLQSFDPNGFTLDYTNADGSATFIYVLALASEQVLGYPTSPPPLRLGGASAW